MSLSSALNNVFALDRQRARYESRPVNSVDAEEDNAATGNEGSERNRNDDANNQSDRDTEATEPSGSSPAAINNNPDNNNQQQQLQQQDSAGSAVAAHENQRPSRRRSSTRRVHNRRRDPRASNGSGENNNNNSSSETEELENSETLVEIPFGEENDDDGTTASDSDDRLFDGTRLGGRNTMTLQELEEQRELSRRRSSACVLLAVFVLFRLWIECLQKQDPTLLLLCLLGTSWTARWIRYNREREEELDRRIENYLQNNNNNNNNNEVDRQEYARLSFQAQLALAIMESQRHMMEGGFGRPDGENENQSPGVSDEAKGQWKQFQWKQPSVGEDYGKKGDYGALPTKADHPAADAGGADNHCSICLSEYEDSESLTQLPCGHVYHNECIQSWTSNHTKCPLCNMDLESASHHGDSIV